MTHALVAEAHRISVRAEALRTDNGEKDEGELFCYLMGKVQGLLDAARMIEGKSK
jgi:hypothetical protein